eukprot:278335-Chlamydomonas_euryale.AAC.11
MQLTPKRRSYAPANIYPPVGQDASSALGVDRRIKSGIHPPREQDEEQAHKKGQEPILECSSRNVLLCVPAYTLSKSKAGRETVKLTAWDSYRSPAHDLLDKLVVAPQGAYVLLSDPAMPGPPRHAARCSDAQSNTGCLTTCPPTPMDPAAVAMVEALGRSLA